MFKDRLKKAQDKAVLQEALKQLFADLNRLGAIPFNVEYKEIYNQWSAEKRQLPVPKDVELYDYAVKFFNIIVKFRDSGVWKKGLLADGKSVDALARHIENAGSWVNAERGQPATEENVYLGNVYGLNTLPIKKWKSVKDDDFVQWAIQMGQLYGCLRSHVEPMKKLLSELILKEQNAKTGFIDRVINALGCKKR